MRRWTVAIAATGVSALAHAAPLQNDGFAAGMARRRKR